MFKHDIDFHGEHRGEEEEEEPEGGGDGTGADVRHGGADEATLNAKLTTLKENFPYFGYGYIKDEAELVPFIPVNFWAFRIMVGLGSFFILYLAYILFLALFTALLAVEINIMLKQIKKGC